MSVSQHRGPHATPKCRALTFLYCSRMRQTGKSYTLEHVVPAVLAEALRKQGGEGPLAGMVVLRLSGDDLNQQASGRRSVGAHPVRLLKQFSGSGLLYLRARRGRCAGAGAAEGLACACE